MVVVIEGLDGVGKTTFCKEFCRKTDFIYIKGSFTDDLAEKKRRMNQLLEYLLDEEHNYIYDRITFIDDFVYTMLNKEPNQLDKYFDIIQLLLSKCTIIHLTIDEKIRRERFNNRGDEFVTNEMLVEVDKSYKEYYKKLGCDVITIQLSNDLNSDVNNTIKFIKWIYEK